MKMRSFVALAVPVLLATGYAGSPASAGVGPGVGNVPQGTQTNQQYADSFALKRVTNVFATTQQTSCYRPEVPLPSSVSLGPLDGYSGESACPGATTGEDTGVNKYSSQVGSNPRFPAAGPMLVKNHSESDIRVDPMNPNHIIGSVKWFAASEGYNHVLGFYESFDGGKTWPVQGHIPGYEGYTDNTDPVGAFDGFGNYYEFLLPYQFFYDKSGFHKFEPGNEPNRTVPNESVSIAVHPKTPLAGVPLSRSWITTHNGLPDDIFSTDAGFGQEPDKQWITIDTNPNSPFFNTIYAMWVNFNGIGSKPLFSTAKALPGGTHTDWTPVGSLPVLDAKQNNSDLLPHVDPSGVVWTTVDEFPGKKGQCCVTHTVDFSTDGGKTWQGPLVVVRNIQLAPFIGGSFANTTFRDGIAVTFAVGNQGPSGGPFPLYVAWEDDSTGFDNVIMSASFDAGNHWTAPIQVNDNWAGATPAATDELQPNLAVADDGTVSVNFYDRRLGCPAKLTTEAANAGLALDTANPHFSGSLPPFGVANYCVNASIQFYKPDLTPIGHNIRLTEHTWDPQLNAATWVCSCDLLDTFIGDYFGNTTGGGGDFSTFVSTFNDTSKPANQQNPNHFQQQVVARIAVP